MNVSEHPLSGIAPGTVSVDAVTGALSGSTKETVQGELHRARAILGKFIAGITDEQGDDRYVLWTIDAILHDTLAIVESLGAHSTEGASVRE